MRAGRLLNLVLLLQHGRATAAELAERLEVTERTVMRDIEALSGAGVPVYAIRGPGGGFQLLEGYDPGSISPSLWRSRDRRPGRPRRATVRISVEGRRLAALLGRLQPLRVKRDVPPDADGWLRASFRLEALDGVAIDVLSSGRRSRSSSRQSSGPRSPIAPDAPLGSTGRPDSAVARD